MTHRMIGTFVAAVIGLAVMFGVRPAPSSASAAESICTTHPYYLVFRQGDPNICVST